VLSHQQKRPFAHTGLQHAIAAVLGWGILLVSPSMGSDQISLPSTSSIDDPAEDQWVAQHYAAMSLDERIGQLLMVRAHSDRGPEYERLVRDWIEDYHVGGLCFFQGTAERQAELTNEYQTLPNAVPLMIAMDAEWGLGMRLPDSTISYPKALTLAAMPDDQLIYQMGKEIGRQCRRLGVHVNFAPVLDVNNNPNNPVINDRSFGEDLDNVISKATAYARGLQESGVLACGKHFPGHGDTAVDSHFDLPVLPHSRQRLHELELVPFRVLLERGLGSLMVAHLSVPALDDQTNLPTSLSQVVVQGILRDEWNYQGLVFTDALEMKGVTKVAEPGMAEVQAFAAGNDCLLLPQDVGQAVSALKAAIETGQIGAHRLEQSVQRILRTKYRLGLQKPQRIEMDQLKQDLNTEDLNTGESNSLRRLLLERSVILVRDRLELVPVATESTATLATLAIGKTDRTAFQQHCSRFADCFHTSLAKDADESAWEEVLKQLEAHETLVVCFHGLNRSPSQNFGLSETDVQRVKRLSEAKPIIVVHFGNPYALRSFDGLPTVIAAFEESQEAQEISAEAIFGSRVLVGRMPVTASAEARFGDRHLSSPQ
jgi:beta-N-acetylhexosaminidase